MPTKSFKTRAAEQADRLENWLQAHLDLLAFLIVTLGLVVRLIAAGKTFLNPDEALHYVIVNQPTPLAAYRASLTNAHPPLIFFLLYYWRFLGRSEIFLRLPSVLAGAATPWVAYRWLKLVSGRSAGMIALLLLTFAPTLISISAELRGYALMLLFLTGALYLLERALLEKSPRRMLWFAIALYLAILTHYSVLWFTLALGIYALVTFVRRRPSAGVLAAWAASQAGAAALYAFLYVTHIAKLSHSPLAHNVMTTWLSKYFFRPPTDTVPAFALRQTVDIFQYLFAQDQAGIIMFLFFVLGLALLLARRNPATPDRPSARELAALLILPFAVGCGGAVAHLYPYGGSRHNLYLAPFAMAGIALVFTRLARQRAWPGLLAAVLLVVACNLDAAPVEYIYPADQARALMSQAMAYLRNSVPPGGLIFSDEETTYMLDYYLCREQLSPPLSPDAALLQFSCGGYRIVAPNLWLIPLDDFAYLFDSAVKVQGVRPGAHVWVARAGWNEYSSGRTITLYEGLASGYPELERLPHQSFGNNICIFEFPVGLAHGR